MKKYIVIVVMFVIGFTHLTGQVEVNFANVPVVSGKVVFEQFLLTQDGASASDRYAALQKWVKSKYGGNPLVTGIRFDDKSQSATVSAKTQLPGVSGASTMNYRFDLSVANAGYVLVVRDITYQNAQVRGAGAASKAVTAEQLITDQAVAVGGDEGQNRTATRKATLQFINGLYKEVSGLM